MRFLVSIRLALRSLRRNPLRSVLTSLGIIIGVAAVVTLVGIGGGARAQIEERIASLGRNLLVIFPGNFDTGSVRSGTGGAITLTPEDAAAIAEEIPGVVAVSPELRTRGQVMASGLNWNTQILGESEHYLEIRSWPLEVGSMFSEDEVSRSARLVVLGRTVADQLFPDGGAVGQILRIRNIPFRVLGVLAPKGYTAEGFDQDDFVLIPYSTYMKRFTRQAYVRSILVQIEDIDRSDETQDYITALLADRHRLPVTSPDFTINDQREIVQRAAAATDAMTALLSAVAAVSLAVGGIGIMNIMLVSVTERTREIGIRVAGGGPGRDVLRQFLVEALMISGLGGLLGVLTGLAAAEAISHFQGWAVHVSPGVILGAVAFSAAIGVFFGYYPARRAAQLDPIEALRFE
jgi:putative ABC transport system permease protein